MSDAPDAEMTGSDVDRDDRLQDDRGWYLYGITLRSGSKAVKAHGGIDQRSRNSKAVKVLPRGDLAAVVRPVALSEFDGDALQARAGDAAWLESMVRGHNQVISAVHQKRAIIPAKFGAVYARVDDILDALERAQDELVAQLHWLEGSDEWAIHVYADPSLVKPRVIAESPAVQQLRSDIESASPGRAYFLQRKLADQLSAALDEGLDALAQAAFDHLSEYAIAGQVGSPGRSTGGELEILHAAFLVRRAQSEIFLGEAQAWMEGHQGMRIESSGPWPPYSFARIGEGERP